MVGVDPIFLSTTIIHTYKSDIKTGSATGFFFENENNELFLVTNKHVIYGENFYDNPSAEVDTFELILHTNRMSLADNEAVKISLFDGTEKNWLEHQDSRVDVILLPIDIDRTRYLLAPATPELLKTENLVIRFEKLFVMGYPYGWYDEVNNLPVTRVGHLSSPFDVPFREQPIMLGDVETHPGMSGGPAFMELKDYVTIENNRRTKHMGASKIILVGIHSGQPRWDLINEDTGEIDNIPHTLINIWNYRLIPDILGFNGC